MSTSALRLLFFSWVLLALTYTPSTAQPAIQPEPLFITQFDGDQGLRQSMVHSIIQDQNGLIWLTTGDGLHYFDGKEFKAFRVSKKEGFDLQENLMRGLVEITNGNFLIATPHSLLLFNPTTARFKRVFWKEGTHPELFSQKFNGKPLVWVEHQLYFVQDERLIPIRYLFPQTGSLIMQYLPRSLAVLGTRKILLAGQEGLLCLQFEHGNIASAHASWIPLHGCQWITSDKTNHVFLLAGGEIFSIDTLLNRKLLFTTEQLYEQRLFVDSKNQFWITNAQKGRSYRWENNHHHVLNFTVREGKYTDTIQPGVLSFFEDNRQNLWFGTDGNGVLFLGKNQVRFMRADVGFTRTLASFNHQIWAGTFNQGLYMLSPDLSKQQELSLVPHSKDQYYLDMLPDQKERLWIASRSGLMVVDHDKKVKFSLKFNSTSAKFFQNSPDTLYLFTNGIRYSFFAGDAIRLIHSSPFPSVSTMHRSKTAYWYGTRYGLYRSEQPMNETRLKLLSQTNRLTTNVTYNIIQIGDQVWVSTRDGIEIYSETGQRIPSPKALKELENEMIYGLVPDHEGRIWFSSNRGIGAIDLQHEHVVYFSPQNNLQSLEFNNNAVCVGEDSTIYFGGINGVNGVQPRTIFAKNSNPKLRLVACVVADTNLVHGIPPAYVTLFLDRKRPHFSGKLFSEDYAQSGTQLFSFLLEGYQTEWGAPSTSPAFSYRDLAPGHYQLFAKCADTWHQWSDPVALASITIYPPFWKTTWFLLIVTIVVILVTALIVRRINSIRFNRRIIQLEHQNAIEKERLRISKDMHDEIGASLTRISILSELAKSQGNRNSDGLKVIDQISEIAGGVVDEMSQIIWAMNPKNDNLDSFVTYVRQYTSSYLEPTDIVVKFDFPSDVPDYMMTAELRRNLFLTIKEALHNIVKHAQARHLHFGLNVTDKVLSISIEDDGKGFDPDHPNHIGNGLHNMRKRIEDSQGRFQLQTNPQKGCRIQLSLHLP